MSDDDIIAMAVSFGGGITGPDASPCFGTAEELLSFARLVSACAAAEEREACAALCDRFAERGMHPAECAAAIRARGQEGGR